LAGYFSASLKKTSAATRYLDSTSFLWVTRVVLGNSDIHLPTVGFQKTPHQAFWQALPTFFADWDAYESRKWRAAQA
jgi:hypothetical protein